MFAIRFHFECSRAIKEIFVVKGKYRSIVNYHASRGKLPTSVEPTATLIIEIVHTNERTAQGHFTLTHLPSVTQFNTKLWSKF